jgi:deoxyribodipyrimidine photo-lyase
MYQHTGILWFRNDLRLHDNEALTEACQKCRFLIPVYVLDPRVFEQTSLGFPKTHIFRAQKILEAIEDLKTSLQKLGSDLLVLKGEPEVVLFDLAKQYKTSWIFCNRERTFEETRVQNELEKKLWSIGQEIWYFRGKMLIHTADLPFPVPHTPDTFTQFRKEVEHFVTIREPLPTPGKIPPLPSNSSLIPKSPDLRDFGLTPSVKANPRSAFPFSAGERAGLERLQYYLFDSKKVLTYKETRNGLLGPDYSTRFSVYLSMGSLSPKLIYHELKRFETTHGANESTYWVYFELLWRDFFRFQAKKYGNKIFKYGGIQGKLEEPVSQANDMIRFKQWCEGKTGQPFVDANMRELNETGFMSNRGRQNVASYLIHDMKLNWLWGAAYFESMLIDYDPCSNYGNWAYLAGVGTDPRPDRHFNVAGQAQKYDPEGKYVATWMG